ncbi:MAG TPA: cupredoxin domain-containing protein [Pyrinomonadaceae bacterium]|jgi:plastocyanin domain-containing protein|nr:cupredoxin domain-containing protein [Pyrinomonadaceae bacterium]
MDTTEIAVVVAGAVLVGLVLWYFFGERERVGARAASDGVQEIDITVKGGYSPDLVVVRAGLPVRLNFYRDETDSCSERVIFGDFHVARELPAFKTTPVEFTPERAGEFTWTCGMSMMRGKLIVEPKSS